jgi:hypothetical protein
MKLICQTDISPEHRILKALGAGALCFSLFTIFIVPPSHLPFINCAFHSITGHSCLTCGMTRSLHAISHGEFTASVRYHLFGPVVFVAMIFCLIIFAAEAIRGKKSELPFGANIRNRTLIFFAIVWLAYWGVRLAAEFAA